MYGQSMNFSEILQELPLLTFEQRQLLIRHAVELDDLALSPAVEAVVESRLAAHYAAPDTSIPLAVMKRRLCGGKS